MFQDQLVFGFVSVESRDEAIDDQRVVTLKKLEHVFVIELSDIADEPRVSFGVEANLVDKRVSQEKIAQNQVTGELDGAVVQDDVDSFEARISLLELRDVNPNLINGVAQDVRFHGLDEAHKVLDLGAHIFAT